MATELPPPPAPEPEPDPLYEEPEPLEVPPPAPREDPPPAPPGPAEPTPETPLVALADAKAHLGITDPARDAEVTAVLKRASAVIFDYMKSRIDPTWDATSAPAVVQAATLIMLGHLWEHRGDDMAPDDHDAKAWEAVARLLMRRRDPAYA